MLPKSVSVNGAEDVRAAHTRPIGICLMFRSVSDGLCAWELRLFHDLYGEQTLEQDRLGQVEHGLLPCIGC